MAGSEIAQRSQKPRKTKTNKNSKINDNRNKYDDGKEGSEKRKKTENAPKQKRNDPISHADAIIKKPYIDAMSTTATASAVASTVAAGARVLSNVEFNESREANAINNYISVLGSTNPRHSYSTRDRSAGGRNSSRR